MSAARLAMVVLLGAGLACGTEIAPEPSGGRIIGEVTYPGRAAAGMARPAFRMVAAADFPPTGQPHAIVVLEKEPAADLSRAVEFELRNLPAWKFRVFGQLLDLAQPDVASENLPLGGYPDLCELASPGGMVEVRADAPVRLASPIVLYDKGGIGDPCLRGRPGGTADPLCPVAGMAVLSLLVRSTRTAGAEDILVSALAASATEYPPRWSQVSPGAEVVFPITITGQVPPQQYLALYVCLDIGSNANTGMCNPAEDAMTLFPLIGAAGTLAAGTITSFDVDLDAGTATVVRVQTAAERGCP
jgi:hypothetical protein